MKRIVVVGATSAIAEHCCRLWVEREPVDLVLVVRDRGRAERIAADLRGRGPESRVRVELVDFLSASEIGALVDRLSSEGPIDVALIAHGLLLPQRLCQQDIANVQETIAVTALSPVLFAEAFAKVMEPVGTGDPRTNRLGRG